MSARILLIGPAWVGDMVIAQALMKCLKAHRPNISLAVLAPPWTYDLLARMPEVDETLRLPWGHGQLWLYARWRLGQQLRARRYEQAIILPNTWKSAFAPWVARIPHRTGWLGEMRFGLLNDWRHLDVTRWPLMVQRFLALGVSSTEAIQALPDWQDYRPRLRVSPENLESCLTKFGLKHRGAPILALCPGAEFGSAKRWPIDHFADIATYKQQEDWQVWLFGSKKDMALSEALQQRSGGNCVNLTGRTTLAEAVDLLSLARAVVTNDSGLMHIAAALQRPLVALYGPTSPHFTPPLSDNYQILQLDLPCLPCFQRACPLQHHHCLEDLRPAQALAALERLKGLSNA